ncbi:MAG: hypothetical protein J6R99_03610 [Alphaproteobacteria bacterium]|nr:hypothetical protein [Alphaproteobacteria bacterium]
MNEISLRPGEEQSIAIGVYSLNFKFNPFDREWLFDMTDADNNIILNNIVIKPNTYPLQNIDTKWDWPRICMIDKYPESQAELNPLLDFGTRLGIFEITED